VAGGVGVPPITRPPGCAATSLLFIDHLRYLPLEALG
jgi:hypothetical protein